MKVWIVYSEHMDITKGVFFSKEEADRVVQEELDKAGRGPDSGWSHAYEQELIGVPPYLKDYGDEPVFVLRGKDSLTPWTIASYMHSCRQKGLHNQAEEVDKALHEVLDWQRHNPDKVKLPDHPHVPVK